MSAIFVVIIVNRVASFVDEGLKGLGVAERSLGRQICSDGDQRNLNPELQSQQQLARCPAALQVLAIEISQGEEASLECQGRSTPT